MSTEIDERVVEMTFDNKRFEKNAEQSISTLGKLKKALKLDGAADALNDVDTAAQKLDLTPLVNAVSGIGDKFSALNIIGVTALTNITNSAVNAGKQLVKSLSVDQIAAGWEKFGSKTSSVATLVSQGYELETVNEQLSRLNWFTDETSYNFTDMVANIAKFTATGQDLETSVTAMEGIANWAALSGQNASTASNAMYQLSQAMGAGVMRKEDYQSIQNASMDTAEFRQKCLDAGVALGTLKKNADNTYTSLINDQGAFEKSQFAEHLTQDAWFTSDVMMKVFGDYSAAVDQIYDYADEKSITASQAIAELGDKVDEFGLKAFRAAQEARTWGDAVDSVKDAVSTGFMTTFEIIFGNQKEATELWTDLANAMYDVFAASGEARNEVLSGWKELGGRNSLIEAFWNTWKAAGAVVAPIKDAFHDIFPPITAERLAELTERLKNFTAKLKISDETAGKIKTTFRGVFSVLDMVLAVVKGLISGAARIIKNFSGITGSVLGAAASVGEWLTSLRDAVTENDIFAKGAGKIADIADKISEKICRMRAALAARLETSDFTSLGKIFGGLFGLAVKLGKAVADLGKQLGSAISKAFNTGGIKGVVDILNGGIFAGILLNVKKFTKGFSDAFGGINDILGGVTGILDGVKGCLSAWQEQLKAGTLMKIAKAVAILAASLAIMAMIDEDRMASSLAGLTALFTELIASLAVFNKINLKLNGTAKAIAAMTGMASAILILSAALKNISSLDWGSLARGLAGVAALCAELVISARAMSTINGKAIKGSTGLIVLAAALKIMASVCNDLAKLSWEELAKGLSSVGVLLAEIDIFLNTAKFGRRAVSTAMGIVITAAAVKILASAAADFSGMNWESAAKGLAGVAGILTEITLFVNLTGKAKKVVATGMALTAVAGALKMFASVCNDLAKLSWEGIAKGLAGMAGALAAVVAAAKLMPKNTIGMGAGLVIIGAAVTILAASMEKLGGMSWEGIAKGLTAVGGSLLIFAGRLNLMKKTAGASASLILASAALGLLVPEIKALGKMNIGQIGTALLALAGAFAVIGISAAVLKPLVGTIIKVSAAMALFGVGVALAGAGLTAAAVGLTALSASLVVVASSLGEIITAVCNSIASSAEAIGNAFTEVARAICNSLRETIPLIADTLVKVLVEALTSLRDYLPKIVDLVFDILSTLLDKLQLRLPELAKKAVDTLRAFFTALDDALGVGGLEKLMTSITAAAGIFLALAAAAKLISSIDTKSAIKGLVGFAACVGAMVVLLAALGGLQQIPGIGWLIDEGAKLFGKIGNAIGAFVGSIINGLVSAMPADISQVLTAISSIELIALAFKPLTDAFGDTDILGAAKTLGIVGIAVGGLTALLVIMGGLAQIPGFGWIIDEGGKLLIKIGTVIGEFIGGLINGVASTVTSGLDDVIKGLLSMVGVVAAVAKISDIIEKVHLAGMAQGIAGIAIAILGITAILSALGALALIPGFEDFLNGGTDILAAIGSAIGRFTGSLISGIGVGATSGLPAMGENLSAFANAVAPFISVMKSVDDTVLDGVLALSGTILALTAADLLQGMAALVGGKASIVDFGKDIAELGPSLVAFSDSVSGLDGGNVKNAADAARALAEMTATIPNEGGVASWFAGENSISKFSGDIVELGKGLSAFSDEVADISPENIKAASEAGKALAEMTATIPNEGGVASWFAGENSISKFSADILDLGKGLSAFSKEASDVSPETVEAAAAAGKALAEMTAVIPNEGGVASWFAGENSISKFGNDIVELGKGLALFSDEVADISPENVKAASEAGKALAEMTATIPNEGGVASWFAGENSISKFGDDIVGFGTNLSKFSENVSGIDVGNVSEATKAAKEIADLTRTIPNSDGVAQWFAGNQSLSRFGDEIADFGTGLNKFSGNIGNINVESVKTAVEAGKALAEMTTVIPSDEGVAQWFAGSQSIAHFGDEIAEFGTGIKQMSDNVRGLDVTAVTAAADAGKTLAEMTSFIPETINVSVFGDAVKDISEYSVQFSEALNGADISAAAGAVREILDLSDSIGNDELTGLNALANTLERAADKGVGNFTGAFSGDDTARNLRTAIAKMIKRAGDEVTANAGKISDALKEAIDRAVEAAKENADIFRDLGKNMLRGFVEGIRNYIHEAQQAAREMASASADAARDELDIHSPSRVFGSIGRYSGMGFVNALQGYADISYDAGSDIGDSAKRGISSAIGKIADIVSGNADIQPTIRPVLDLSDISENVGRIDAMLSREQAVGISADISAARERSREFADISGRGCGSNITFTQNITSPKALDAKTIYRQTRNQFSRMKEVLGT